MGLLDFLKKGEEKKVEPIREPTQPMKDPKPSTVIDSNPLSTPVIEEYTVKTGDSLSKIAKQIYGDAQKWNIIYESNKDTIENPDLIHPGQKIKIPKI